MIYTNSRQTFRKQLFSISTTVIQWNTES